MGAGSSVFQCFGNSGAVGEKPTKWRVAGSEWLVTGGEEPSSAERLRVGEQGVAMIELVGFLDAGQKKSALEGADMASAFVSWRFSIDGQFANCPIVISGELGWWGWRGWW